MEKQEIFIKDESYYQLSRPELLPFLPLNIKSMKVLEVGCGAGSFKRHFQCVEYWGIEPNATMADYARRHLDKVLAGNFDEVSELIPDNFFDLVICNDVIEHMVNVEDFLQGIRVKMKPNGQLLGSIPNVRYIENIIRFMVLRDWRYVEWGILDSTHLRFFTEKSLKRFFNENQFQIIKFAGINPVSVNFRSIKSFL